MPEVGEQPKPSFEQQFHLKPIRLSNNVEVKAVDISPEKPTGNPVGYALGWVFGNTRTLHKVNDLTSHP